MLSLPTLLLLGATAALVLGWFAVPVIGWLGAVALLALLGGAGLTIWVALGVVALLTAIPVVRRIVLSGPILKLMKAMELLPTISQTERDALEAGSVWVDGELFSGAPDTRRLLQEGWPGLDEQEQAFLDGPVTEVCELTDDWDVQRRGDLPQPVWDALRRHGFFGMIIPKEYGGLGFSPSANSAIVSRLSSRSTPLGVTVMVPNSLGPAELLVHYGTDEQKQHWLPKLATGEAMPAFALTEPGAGSDAGAIASKGVVFRGDDGQLMLRLDWNKRYITLAAVSTVLGLAFQLEDPEHLLGDETDLGITCALVPSDTAGVVLGRRHDPMGIAFYNCPTQGHGVEVPLEDAIIGGAAGAGRGWRMLMECLAAGRGISLPANASGACQMAARATGAYAAVRRQFGVPIGRFEGIEEPLARIAGTAWLLEAARRYTCGGLDGGAKPAVVTAITKYNFTELARSAITDAMDVMGGAAISRGPRNLMAHAWQGAPISITVEGANILTRCLMIFGQGAIRCHPWVQAEIAAADAGDVAAFDKAFWGHVGHVVRNTARSILLSVTRGRLAGSPVDGPAAKHWRRLSWASASFAFHADLAMATLGGALKRREALAGRFADIVSWMYLATAALRRFEAEGRRPEDVPLLDWSLETAFGRMQDAFDGVFRNLGVPVLGSLLAGPGLLWSRLNPLGLGPDDELGARVARSLGTPGEQRDRITPMVHLPASTDDALGRLERAFLLCVEADGVARRIKDAARQGRLPRAKPLELLDEAVEADIISAADASLVRDAEAAREDVIQVDSFTLDEYLAMHGAGLAAAAESDELPEPEEARQA
jgi:acyl-CoA dehydrogenase